MAIRIAFINGKGGCGKTTSLFHTAGVLSKQGEKVLAIDLDKQRNLSDTLLGETSMPPKTVLDFMEGKAKAEDCTQQALFRGRGKTIPRYYNVDCMIADANLHDQKRIKKVNGTSFQKRLDEFIEKEGYTWVLVDMPPSNSAIDHVCFSYIVNFIIVPFSSDIYSVSGYDDIMSNIEKARENNPNLEVLGIFLSRYTANSSMDKYIKDELSSFSTFIDVQIPQLSDVREGILFNRPISFYKTFSQSKKAYEDLVKEMRKRIDILNKRK